ncbi:MAG: iron-containing alcohol dehydrogenase [Spirochaetales bacterium]
MNDFTYFTPTKVVFAKNAESQVGNLVADLKCKKVLVHYGGESAKKSGLLDRVFASLNELHINYTVLGGVVPNPLLSMVRKGIELCKSEGVDFILAVGGGSVIDSAKAIAYGVANDCDVWDIYLQKVEPTACLPLGCVLTIAAAGSEMSNSSVITNEDGLIKRGYGNNLCRCAFAVMNPELTSTLPEWQTMSGAVDIMMHTFERYFYQDSKNTDTICEMTDRIGEGLIKTVMKNALILKDSPKDYNARAEIMWAGSLSHNGLTGCGYGMSDWATHQIEHELSGMFNVTHGAGLAAVWGSWARYVCKENTARFAQFARNVFSVEESSDEKACLAGIEATENFFRSINMPVSIKELGYDLSEKEIDELAYKCSFEKKRTIGSFKVLDYEDIRTIYKNAL